MRLLDDANSIVRWNAPLIVGQLAGAWNGNALAPLIERLLAPVTGPRLIDANCAMRAATAMAAAKPQFAERVAARPMETERGESATPECRNVATGLALECLARLLPLIACRKRLRALAERQAGNSRPGARKRAERLSRKCGLQEPPGLGPLPW